MKVPVVSALINDIRRIADPHAAPVDVSVQELSCLLAAFPLSAAYKTANGASAALFPSGTYPAFPTTPFGRPASHGTRRVGAADDGISQDIHFAAVGVQSVWSLFDVGIDTAGGDPPFVLSIIDIVFLFLEQALNWPSDNGVPWKLPLQTKAEKAKVANWIVGWTFPLVDGTGLVLPELPDGHPGRIVLRAWDPTGELITSVLGVLNIAAGIAESVEGGEDAGKWVANILGPLSHALQFLTTESVEEMSDELSLAVKLVVDFFSGEGAAVGAAAGG